MGFMCGVPENRDMCKNNSNFKVIEPFFLFCFFGIMKCNWTM